MVAKSIIDLSMDNVAADCNDDIIPMNHISTMPPQHPPPLLPPPPARPRPRLIRRASFDMALEMGHRREIYTRQRFGSGGMLGKLQRFFMACQCRNTPSSDHSQALHPKVPASSETTSPTDSFPHILAAKFDSSQDCLVPPPIERVIPPFKPFSKKANGLERGFGDGAETASGFKTLIDGETTIRTQNGMEPDLDKLLTQLASEEPALQGAPIEKTFLYLVLKVERQKCQLQAAEAELKELRRQRDEAQNKLQRLRKYNHSVESEGSEFATSDTTSTINSSGRKQNETIDKGPIKEHDKLERTSSAGSSKSTQSRKSTKSNKSKTKASTKRKNQFFNNGRPLHPKANCPVLNPSDLEEVSKDSEPVVLGQGNCGRVDLMRIKDTGDLVAMKTVLPENQIEPEKWILREVRAMKAVTGHEAFAQLYGVVDHTPLTTVVIQFVGDYTLLAPITVQSALEDGDPPLADTDWVMVCRDMATGLDALHKKGFLHCDMKMDNVLLWREPANNYSRWQAKIIDLDSARNFDDLPEPLQLSSSEKEQCFQFCLHIAPELIEGVTTYTTQTEIYALGLLFSDIADQSQDNRELKRLGAKCLERKPRRRPKMGYILRKLGSMKV